MRRLLVVALAAALLALPSAASAAPINFLSISPSQVNNGDSATGLVSLAFADTVPTTVRLFSSNPSVAQVPASIVVPAGVQETTFTITTSATAPAECVQITAAVDNVPRQQNMCVNQAPPAGSPTFQSVSLNPTTVTAGGGVTGTVTFSAPMTNGANVQLLSSNPAVASVPSETVVNANARSGAFAVTTRSVSTQTTVTITAKWLGITRTATLTVRPGTPQTDVVRITEARWDKGLLRIQATSTNPNAILTVRSRSGAFMFTLTNNGGGRYSDQRGWVTNPEFIEVRSNFGGRASATLRR